MLILFKLIKRERICLICKTEYCNLLIVPRLFEEKWRDTVFGFPWGVVRGAWRVVRGSEFLVGTLSP